MSLVSHCPSPNLEVEGISVILYEFAEFLQWREHFCSCSMGLFVVPVLSVMQYDLAALTWAVLVESKNGAAYANVVSKQSAIVWECFCLSVFWSVLLILLSLYKWSAHRTGSLQLGYTEHPGRKEQRLNYQPCCKWISSECLTMNMPFVTC